jgi:hypothetical protein
MVTKARATDPAAMGMGRVRRRRGGANRVFNNYVVAVATSEGADSGPLLAIEPQPGGRSGTEVGWQALYAPDIG